MELGAWGAEIGGGGWQEKALKGKWAGFIF